MDRFWKEEITKKYVGFYVLERLLYWTFLGRKKVLDKLFKQGLKKIEISNRPFKGDKAEIELIDISEVVNKKD